MELRAERVPEVSFFEVVDLEGVGFEEDGDDFAAELLVDFGERREGPDWGGFRWGWEFGFLGVAWLEALDYGHGWADDEGCWGGGGEGVDFVAELGWESQEGWWLVRLRCVAGAECGDLICVCGHDHVVPVCLALLAHRQVHGSIAVRSRRRAAVGWKHRRVGRRERRGGCGFGCIWGDVIDSMVLCGWEWSKFLET